MKRFIYECFTALMMLSGAHFNLAYAQGDPDGRSESAVAILDTSIPFAIGAREGEQTIRGSFGWPTFQEGFVEGVYFRFDPDGYARFSKSPRLDEDVFEVLCEVGTKKCIAKKNGLEISLTDRGQPHLNILGLTVNDRFFLSDRKTELPLPKSILGPLDQRLEALLSSDGDLIIRRELETLQTLSLSGFLATVTYLRWVAQNQASFIFPRGWPVPSQQDGLQGNRSQNASTNLSNAVQNQESRWGALNVEQSVNTQQQYANTSVLQSLPNELPAVEFAQQAQGRSLTSDINKFTLPSTAPLYNQNSATSIPADQNLRLELSYINRALGALEIKLDNLSQILTHDKAQAVKSHVAQSPNNQSFEISRQNKSLTLDHERDGEKMREAVIKSILSDVENAPNKNSDTPNSGEVSVKKTIVERLLEELGSTQHDDDLRVKDKPITNGGFISLSDYINKVMQEEAKP
ncbi:hypothetical protein F9L33_08915 [Amylibacter sp. SFDW26]|uniref:hypothetical protein n=1 Tax=Amylibacter sp. SFDW26 TaxID=2652722 RepID=UPI00126263B5|nr:hypothetical protein [Amylibacter sp. SFDW26]KAB7614736.1 hypothetical protein F9L33_08915 [Amylibacter sp. SFDW26]